MESQSWEQAMQKQVGVRTFYVFFWRSPCRCLSCFV